MTKFILKLLVVPKLPSNTINYFETKSFVEWWNLKKKMVIDTTTATTYSVWMRVCVIFNVHKMKKQRNCHWKLFIVCV